MLIFHKTESVFILQSKRILQKTKTQTRSSTANELQGKHPVPPAGSVAISSF